MVLKLLLLCIWVIYSLLEGVRDAFYYNSENKSSSTNTSRYNIHWIFFVCRVCVWMLIGIIIYFSNQNNTLTLFLFSISLSLIFSYLHNGIYYYMRNQLDPTIYQKAWFDDSNSSTAILEFDYKTRTLMMIIGILSIVVSFIV